MALRKKTLAIPLTGPLERRNGGEDLTANLTALPAVPRALNVYRSRTGEWKRRPGHTAVTLPVAARPIVGGCSTGGQLRVFAEDGQFYKSDTNDTAFSQSNDLHTVAIGARTSILDGAFSDQYSASDSEQVSVAAGGGVILAASRLNSTPPFSRIALTAVRADDGSVIVESSNVSGLFVGGSTRVVVLYSAALGFFTIIYTIPGNPSTAATTLSAYTARDTSIIAGTAGLDQFVVSRTDLATDLIGTATSANAHFDAIVEEDTGTILIAYRGTGGNTRSLRFNPQTFVITGPVTTVAGGDVAANGLAWMRCATFPQTDYRLFTAINAATGIVDRRVNKAALTQTSSLTVKASPGDVGSITAFLEYGASPTDTSGRHAIWDVVNAEPGRSALWDSTVTAGVWSSGELASGVSTRLHGHVFVAFSNASVSAGWVVPVCGSVDVSGKLLFSFVDGYGSFGNYLTSALDGKSDFAPIVRSHLGHVSSYGGKFYYGAVEWLSRATTPDLSTTAEGAFSKCAKIVVFQLTGQRATPVMLDPDTALIPGAVWTKSDGVPYSGGPFPYYQSAPPSGFSPVSSTGLLTVGDYFYSSLVVVIDPKGRRWASLPSLPIKATITGVNNQFTYTTAEPPTRFAGRNTSLEIYRSKVNGTQQFRARSFALSVFSPSMGSANLSVDQISDAVLETALPLYSDSGELIHFCPPPSNAAWVAGQRILCVASERPGDVWASSEFTPGEGPWFHPDMRISVPGGEEIVAGAFMDGRSFLFTRKSIFTLAGAWPGRSGAGQLPEVQRVATGVGGYSMESTVVTAEGIWFYSEDRGQCLLTRGLSVTQAGKIVDGVITSAPVAAIQVEKYDQVRLYQSDGVVAVYDQVERQWSHWQIASAALGGETVRGAFVHNRDVYVFTATKLFKEDATALDDAGAAFSVDVDLRIPIGPPGGKARIYRAILAGICYGDTTLTCTLFNDFGNVGSGEEIKTMVIKARPGETSPGLYEQTIKPRRGRCDSMLLRLSYQSTDPGLTYRSLAIEVGGYQPATVARAGSGRQA